MTNSTRIDTTGAGGWAIRGLPAVFGTVLCWPIRVYRARQLLHQLAGLEDRELRDIGLIRQDLRDAGSLPFDADPSLTLRRRAEARRRRR